MIKMEIKSANGCGQTATRNCSNGRGKTKNGRDQTNNDKARKPQSRDPSCHPCLDVCDKVKDYEDEDECKHGSIWVILTCLFAMIALILLITLIAMCVLSKPAVRATTNNCATDSISNSESRTKQTRQKRHGERVYFTQSNGSDVFDELTPAEIRAIVDFLHAMPELKLVSPENVAVDSNFIHAIEMKMPSKDQVVAYLNGKEDKPERQATVILFRGGDIPPTVDEYVVGGFGRKMYAHLMVTDRRQTKIPFIYRPFSVSEFMAVFKNVLVKIVAVAGHVLKESYGALPMKCGDKCLKLSMAPVSSNFLEEGKRKAWFWFQYDLEFPSVRPLDFQFLVDTTSVHPNQWEIQNVWYANQMFQNLTVFINAYNEGSINKTRLKFPEGEESSYGSMEFRTPLMPSEPLRAPRQFEPDGKRFMITGNEIHYMNWKTNFRVSTTGGLQLMNIRFNTERIVYELSMQEVVVMYGGHQPVARIMNYADGAGLYGTRYRGLLPGVDCPGQAQFVNTYLYTSNELGGRIFENAFCVFELNTHSPLRRHRAYSRSGALYGGMEAMALVVRAVISVLNYDYSFDFIFYQNGAIETKVSMTGFLGTVFYFPEEYKYGTQVHKNVAAPLHNHLFNFKVDLDIKGTENRYETLDLKTSLEKDPWVDNVTQYQTFIERNLYRTEQSALYKYHFETPKVHVFSNYNHVSKLGNPRAYRLLLQKMSRQLHPAGTGFEKAVPWSHYQMAVTRYKPEEERSSSVYTMWDARDPVVNFNKYIDDNDNIVDEDLVAWITLGTQHIPQTENLPTTTTIGSQLSFFILPFNYFDEDPSMHSRDAVRITPRDTRNTLNGANVEQYGAFENVQCAPFYEYPHKLLEKNSTFLFS